MIIARLRGAGRRGPVADTALRTQESSVVSELALAKGFEELEVVPDMKYMPEPGSREDIAYYYATISASLERGLKDYLRKEMKISVI